MAMAKKKTPKRLTKRERKALEGKGNARSVAHHAHEQHIHCVACGKHLDAAQFSLRPATAQWITCQHGSRFASCAGCVSEAQRRLDEHDRTGQAVETAAAWH
jgi:RNA polymerase-binding transcription factor DksA